MGCLQRLQTWLVWYYKGRDLSDLIVGIDSNIYPFLGLAVPTYLFLDLECFITPCRAGRYLTRLGDGGCFGGTIITQGGPISIQGGQFVMGK